MKKIVNNIVFSVILPCLVITPSLFAKSLIEDQEQKEREQKAAAFFQKLRANPEGILQALHPLEYKRLQEEDEQEKRTREAEEEKTSELSSLLKDVGHGALAQFRNWRAKSR